MRIGRRESRAEPPPRLGLLDAICEVSGDGIAVSDEQGRAVFANRRLAEIIGSYAEEGPWLRHSRPATARPAGAVACPGGHCRRDSRGRSTAERAWEIASPGGERRWLRVRVQPFVVAGARFLLFTVRDVTESRRVAAERESLLVEVRQRAAELDATFASIPDGVVIFAPDSRITRMNPTAATLLGYSADTAALPLAERLRLAPRRKVDGTPLTAARARWGAPCAARPCWAFA